MKSAASFLRRRPRPKTSRRLQLEPLEDRSLMALVSFWSADNTAIDSVSGNNGTLYNGATYAAGQVGQAFSFDGVNDRINVADSPSFKLTQSLSIEAWINVNAFPTGAPNDHGEILFRGDDRGGLDPYSLSVEPNGQVSFQISSLTGGVSLGAPIATGQFVHVAAVLDDAAGTMKLYENGALVTQLATAVRPFADLDPASNPGVGIGNHGGYPNTPHNFPFNGRIDELKLYSHALTAADVLADYDATKGPPSLYVSDATTTEGSTTAAFAGYVVPPDASGLAATRELLFGPDGNMYVANHDTDVVKVFASDGQFIRDLGTSGGELDGPWGMLFGPDSKLYVGGRYSHNVVRFDISSGNYDVFVPSASGGLGVAKALAFGSDGNLYVTSNVEGMPSTASVKRFDGNTGSYIDDFVSAGSGGLSGGAGLAFGPDGNIYVTSGQTGDVKRYSGVTGAFINNFIPAGLGGLSGPNQLLFHSDGLLYVSGNNGSNSVLRYNPTTGAFVDVFASGLAITATGIAFAPSGDLYVSEGTATLASGSNVARFVPGYTSVNVSLAYPDASTVNVNYATANGTAVAGSDYLATSGTLTFAPGVTTLPVLLKVVDDSMFEPDETFVVNLSLPTGGATIADAQGVITIHDNDIPPTKFYVVNDGTNRRTYEYAANGSAVENYAINSGNSAPRGAASTAAGDKVWVVDSNRNVYVYNTSGGLLGSWAVGGFNNSAQLEGISVNGNDVWIVDAKSDKVYRYTGAASRLSGTQTAASSFSLNSSNGDATDLVTDGTSIWVLNNASTDKVFKYTVGGSLLGSWTINSGGGSPTGLTIDPSNATPDIWIVDSASDKVYQFNNARGITSGSLNATVLYSLSSTNTNPQGIADPPPSSLGGLTAPLSSSSTDSTFDSALLSVVGELDDLLMGGKKRK